MEEKDIKIELIKSFNNNFDYSIEIDGKKFTIQEEVCNLIVNISLERDELRAKAN